MKHFEDGALDLALYECELASDTDLSEIMAVATGGYGATITDPHITIVNKWSFHEEPLKGYVNLKTVDGFDRQIEDTEEKLKWLKKAKKDAAKKLKQ